MIRDNDELRDSIHAALDEVSEPVPSLVPGAMARIRTIDRHRPRWVLARAVSALAIAAAVGGVVLASHRAVATRQPPAATAPAATASITATVVNPASCQLPVIVYQAVEEAGFVSTATGQYTKDASASVAGLPGGGSEGTSMKPAQPSAPAMYSHVLERWLPVDAPSVAPDGRSYVWVRLMPAGSNETTFKTSELHRYDVASRRDQTLWTYAGSIKVWRWDAAGILLTTFPTWWRIDPISGAATQQPRNFRPDHFTELPGDAQNGGLGWTTFGTDDQGRPIFRIGGRDPGARDWVFVETAPGQRIWIYRGTQGDATGFDPFQAVADSTGVWFGDLTSRAVWHWQQYRGLQKYPIKGLPGNLAGGASTDVYALPAGKCQ
jgi:hypothetical protein